MKIFIIAGEASGDILGARLMVEIKKYCKNHKIPEPEFVGIGGEHMIHNGIKSIFPMHLISIMGFFNIISQIPKLLKLIKKTSQHICDINPDIVITIDSPGFSFRVIKNITRLSCKKVHYVAPSVWAYNEKRAEYIAPYYDLILALLPFEPPYFTKYGLRCEFVGHPVIENVLPTKQEIKDFKLFHKISDKNLVMVVLIGSRLSEINKLAPIVSESIELIKSKFDNLYVIFPTLEHLKPRVQEFVSSLNCSTLVTCNEQEKFLAYKSANVAIAKSGTGALELALYELPHIVIYKVDLLSYLLLKFKATIHFVNLVNILLDKEIVPELLQKNCNPQNISNHILEIVANKSVVSKQIAGFKKALEMLGKGSKVTPSANAAKYVMDLLYKPKNTL